MANGAPDNNQFVKGWCTERHLKLDSEVADITLDLKNTKERVHERIDMVDGKHDSKFNKVLFFLVMNLGGVIATLITLIVQILGNGG